MSQTSNRQRGKAPPGLTPASPAPRTRIEHDSMGELEVPADALWGAQTQRAVLNFPVSGRPMPRGFIRALGLVKAAAAEVNAGLGLLPPPPWRWPPAAGTLSSRWTSTRPVRARPRT